MACKSSAPTIQAQLTSYVNRTPAEYFWLKSLKSKFFLTVQNHPMLDEARDHLGLTPMHNLVLDGRISLLKHQLECEPQSVSFKDTWGATPLHWAARCADIQAISLLLSYGADVNAVCKRGRSILHWTFNPECCKAIIEAGANVDLLDDNGESVLVRCFDFFQVPEALIDVLLEAGVNVNSKSNSGTTALMQAVITASSHICDRLMSYGADTEIRNLDGCTPIYSAIWYNNHSNIRLLMDRGASLTSLDNHGRSIVQYAAVWADLETMDILRRARIKGLCMNACVIKRSWDWFSHRDTFFVGERAPQNQEVAAFQALLDSVVPAADTPAVLAVEDLRIPGAFFIEPSNEMEA
jgi:ankyrin repeat protein